MDHIMTGRSADEVLSILKANTPLPGKAIAALRQDFARFYLSMQGNAISDGNYRIRKEILPDNLDAYWITLPETRQDRVLLFFHGGGFTIGSTADHLGLCIRLARASRASVFSVDYSLAPEHTFPAPVNDAGAAFRYLVDFGYSPDHILPVGISAGGTLVLSLLIALRDAGYTLPPAAACMSPATDLLFFGESVEKNAGLDWITAARLASIRTVYLGGCDPTLPLASPVHADLRNLPRLYIQAGTHELLFSDIMTFIGKARHAGVPVDARVYEGMFHCWQIFADDLGSAREAIDHLGRFARDIFSGPATS
jgi:acetyl esterase/lipase